MSKSSKMRRGEASGRRGAVSVSVMVLVAFVMLACGAAVGFLTTRGMVPETVVSATEGGSVRPVRGQFDDARSVTVTVSSGQGQSVVAGRGGKVTADSCAPGTQAVSGTSLFAIDGTPQLMLHVATPLYRPLTSGMKGQDAAALNAELRRLGYAAPNGNAVTWDTIVAYNALARNVGTRQVTRDSGWTIAVDDFIWLAQPDAAIASCQAQLGSVVGSGEALFSTLAAPTHADVSMPEDVIAGERELVVDDAVFDLPQGSTQITDPTVLDAILGSNEYLSAKTESSAGQGTSMTATGAVTGSVPVASVQARFSWRLKTPLQVWQVPPAALYDVNGSSGCVVSDGKPVAVNVIASELGKTKVTVDGSGVLGKVNLEPSGFPACR